MSVAAWVAVVRSFGCRIVEWLACSALGDCGLKPGAYRDAARFGRSGVERPGMRGPGAVTWECECTSLSRAVIEQLLHGSVRHCSVAVASLHLRATSTKHRSRTFLRFVKAFNASTWQRCRMVVRSLFGANHRVEICSVPR
jgi:hypothetical protein